MSDVKPLFRTGDLLNGVHEIRSLLGHGAQGPRVQRNRRAIHGQVAHHGLRHPHGRASILHREHHYG